MKYWSMRELVYGPLRYYNSTVDNLNMGGSDDSGSLRGEGKFVLLG